MVTRPSSSGLCRATSSSAGGLQALPTRLTLGLLLGLLVSGLISEQLLTFNSGWLPWFLVGFGGVLAPARAGDPVASALTSAGAPAPTS